MPMQKKPYPVIQMAGILTSDTPCMTKVYPDMTCGEWDDMLLANFEKNLERGNEVMRRLQKEQDIEPKPALDEWKNPKSQDSSDDVSN
jgi:hypothetical protein